MNILDQNDQVYLLKVKFIQQSKSEVHYSPESTNFKHYVVRYFRKFS